MFRPLRRADHALTKNDLLQLLRTERRGVLAMTGDGGYPYAVPVNFYYDEKEERILFHGSRAGHKADSLKRDDRVCFTVYGGETILPEEPWAPVMRSAVVFGRCAPLTDPNETLRTLRLFAQKYYPDENTLREEIGRSGRAVRMYAIRIEHMSGKEIREK